MSGFTNENLELWTDKVEAYVRCATCHQVLSAADQDWREACRIHLVTPQLEPLVAALLESYSYRERCCPSCGTLLETDLLTESET